MQAREIEPELKRLISIASSIEPRLAKRLDELRRWIKDKKPGLLTSKRFVMDFLLEVIVDAETYLDLKALNIEERQEVFEQMTPTLDCRAAQLRTGTRLMIHAGGLMKSFYRVIVFHPNVMLNAALILETTMTTRVKASSQNRVEKALESLHAARTLQRDRQIWSVGRVNRHVEDVDGDWLEKWGEDEEQPADESN